MKFLFLSILIHCLVLGLFSYDNPKPHTTKSSTHQQQQTHSQTTPMSVTLVTSIKNGLNPCEFTYIGIRGHI